jgi:hypothetical protein
MKFPIYVQAEECAITDPLVHPLWETSYEREDRVSPGTFTFSLWLAHPLQIREEMKSAQKRASFVERLSNGEKDAMAIWEEIKAELDVFNRIS